MNFPFFSRSYLKRTRPRVRSLFKNKFDKLSFSFVFLITTERGPRAKRYLVFSSSSPFLVFSSCSALFFSFSSFYDEILSAYLIFFPRVRFLVIMNSRAQSSGRESSALCAADGFFFPFVQMRRKNRSDEKNAPRQRPKLTRKDFVVTPAKTRRHCRDMSHAIVPSNLRFPNIYYHLIIY